MQALTAEMDDATLRSWLREEDPARVARLFATADAVRAAAVGDAVHLRGLIELSNACVRACAYCGLSVHHRDLPRYRMTAEEVLDCARRAAALGYGTVVLQAGEDPALSGPLIADLIRAIKRETGLAITLSLGERSPADWRLWREAGADRYLLRFETSNPRLYARIHPPARHDRPWDGQGEVPRVRMLRELQDLGYEAGTGIMVGIPGQTWDDLISDLRTFQRLDIEMIGVGPYIPHPETPLAHDFDGAAEHGQQVPNDLPTTLKVVALSRLLVPDANIPATTAVATLDKAQGREDALRAGANVVMPNLTPPQYRVLYEIYPEKACIHETAEQCHACLTARIHSIGRRVGTGPGSAPKRRRHLLQESA
ncbi:MAG: [FeFe] hydrogenase H-cluster radical SAM maturase HydE [Planctomycetota bacterium]|nr:[FeFe] hydrogenase H-cluster radical SAM maturase HydE [Planctomycetota bacterium]